MTVFVAAGGRRGAISGALRRVSLVLGVLSFASSLLILEMGASAGIGSLIAVVVLTGRGAYRAPRPPGQGRVGLRAGRHARNDSALPPTRCLLRAPGLGAPR